MESASQDNWLPAHCSVHVSSLAAFEFALPHSAVPQLLRPLVAGFNRAVNLRCQHDAQRCVTSISIDAHSDVTDAVSWAASFPKLTQLDIDGPSIDADTLKRIRDNTFSALRDLRLCGSEGVDNISLHVMGPMPSLHALSLRMCSNVNASALEQVQVMMPALRTLDVSFCSSVDVGALEPVSRLPDLTSLDLSCCSDIDTAALELLTKVPCLEHLNLSSCCLVGSAPLTPLANMPRLRKLRFDNSQELDAEALEPIGQALRLQDLTMRSCHFVDERAISHLRPLTSLESLNLSGCHGITAAALVHIAAIRSLRSLELKHCVELSGAALAPLTALPHLTFLDVGWCEFRKGKAHAALSGMTQLHELVLEVTSGVDVAQLKVLPLLHTIDVGGTDVSAAAVKHLATFPKLRRVGLCGCRSVDNDAIMSLAAAPTVLSLCLRGTSVDKATVSELRKTTPYIET